MKQADPDAFDSKVHFGRHNLSDLKWGDKPEKVWNQPL